MRVAGLLWWSLVRAELPAEPLGTGCQFERLATRPRLFRCKGYASAAWTKELVAEAESHLADAGGGTCKNNQCRSYLNSTEDFAKHPALTSFVDSLYNLFPEEAAADARESYRSQPLNMLSYHVGGETLGWHTDPQKNHPTDLVASAILYIGSPEAGGETSFVRALPGPVMVPPDAGDLAIFISCDKFGDDDEKSLHKGSKVAKGRKLVLEKFFGLPRWFCMQDFTFAAPDDITAEHKTAKAAGELSEIGDSVFGAGTEAVRTDSTCHECLDYCGAWNVCIERAQRACPRADHVTGDKDFAERGFSMLCPKGDALSLGRKFLDHKGHEKGVTTLQSGLLYRVLRAGHGKAHPQQSSTLTYHYRLTLTDGTEVGSSYKKGEPTTGTLDATIKGFAEALRLMVEGDVWTLYVPSELAYRDQGAGGVIPAHSVLIFMVHLLEVVDDKSDL